jgi:tRNA (guanine26-N2/guanine27-N2)-dimethyltransferase
MAGIGARGLRVAKECGEVQKVTLVDFNREALKVARKAAVLNGVSRKCEFSDSETSSYLVSRYGRDQRFDFVDVDPFGTPVRQLQPALTAVKDGGTVSITATDTAVLCGVYPKVSERRYGSTPLNNHFHHETAIRILFAALARQGAPLDLGVVPVFAHASRHYVRVYARVSAGATKADSTLTELGFVSWCRACGHTTATDRKENSCEKCGAKARTAGPLWIGSLGEVHISEAAASAARKMGLLDGAQALGSFAKADSFPPWSFNIDEICSRLKMATVPESVVWQNLLDAGFRVVKTPFETDGIKTNADSAAVFAAVRGSSSKRSDPFIRAAAESIAKINAKKRF